MRRGQLVFANLGLCLAVILIPVQKASVLSISAEAAGAPAFTDADGDGIPDSLETSGFEIEYPDGTRETLKSTPNHKDIFVFVAWMANGDHSHRPNPAAIAAVIDSFKNAPVQNLDNQPGISLHVIYAHSPVPEQQVLGSWTTPQQYDWTAFNQIKAQVFPHLVNANGIRLDEFVHFCLFAHTYSADMSSGLTNTIPGQPGADFMVTLGGFFDQKTKLPIGTPAQQAGTFMHELGHALGLRHGGIDDILYKPNYVSIMNYFFQMSGIQYDGDAQYTYSSFELSADENDLNGKQGLSPDSQLAKFGSQYYCPNDVAGQSNSHPIATFTGRVDWVCNGQYQDHEASDINADGQQTLLNGRNDWSTIQLKFGSSIGAAGVAPPREVLRELSPEISDSISKFPIDGVTAKKIPSGVQIRWTPLPLGQVLLYAVYRQSPGEGQPTVLDTTEGSTYTDIAQLPRGSQYFVVGLYAPQSRRAQTANGAKEMGLKGLAETSVFASISRNSNFMERVAGIGPAIAPAAPPVLLATPLSKAATVE